MYIVCQADDSHEMSRLVFSEKKKIKKNKNKLASAADVIGALRVKSVQMHWLVCVCTFYFMFEDSFSLTAAHLYFNQIDSNKISQHIFFCLLGEEILFQHHL